MRDLAGRSTKAAKETAEMIDASVSRATHGMNVAIRTSDVFKEIVSETTRVSTLVSEIAEASREQVRGIEQVSQGLEDIDVVTQQNSSVAEGASNTAAELSSEANQSQRDAAAVRPQQRGGMTSE